MRNSILFLSTIFSLILVLTACGSEQSESQTPQTTSRQLDFTEEVVFLNSTGEEISAIKAALADDQGERNQGLMDVTDLPQNAGMIFVFEEQDLLSFYMANTPLPLDIMYVNSDSVIVRIYHNTTPFDNSQLPSGRPAQFVVETNGGFAVANDIQEGMKVRF
jgi:uncharacterized membrane protein (UPF0127 family)